MDIWEMVMFSDVASYNLIQLAILKLLETELQKNHSANLSLSNTVFKEEEACRKQGNYFLNDFTIYQVQGQRTL